MKAIILKEKFNKGLSIVERITGKNLTLPILNNVLISAEDSFLKLSTTDLELGISYWSPAKIEDKGKITIPAKTLSGFIPFIDEEKLLIETKDKVLSLKGKNYKTQIKGLDAKDFPIIPEVTSEIQLEITTPSFLQGIGQVIDFCALTQVRPELSGVYFFFQKDQVKIVATDSFRLAEKTVLLEKVQEGLNSPQALILPRNAAREMVNIFSEESTAIKLYFSSSQIMAESYLSESKNPKIRFVSRLVEGEYPNYEEVIPKQFKTKLILQKEQFLNQIKGASLFSGRTNEVNLKINPKKGEIIISSQNIDLGETQFNVPAEIQGEEGIISFNYKFLVEGLSQIKTEQVVFELNGQDGPGVLKPVEDASFLYVIMPIKAS